MKAARALVQTFTASTQMNDRLLAVQNNLPAAQKRVTVIQDIQTRWWSTFSMLERLLRLRRFFEVMEVQENPLRTNLDANHWLIINDLVTVLQPFMLAQKVLEGEKYVTISLILGILSMIYQQF